MTRELRPCGTVAAYERHRRRGPVTCRPCLDAWAYRNGVRRSGARYRPRRSRVTGPLPPVMPEFRALLDLIAAECRRAGYLPEGRP